MRRALAVAALFALCPSLARPDVYNEAEADRKRHEAQSKAQALRLAQHRDAPQYFLQDTLTSERTTTELGLAIIAAGVALAYLTRRKT